MSQYIQIFSKGVDYILYYNRADGTTAKHVQGGGNNRGFGLVTGILLLFSIAIVTVAAYVISYAERGPLRLIIPAAGLFVILMNYFAMRLLMRRMLDRETEVANPASAEEIEIGKKQMRFRAGEMAVFGILFAVCMVTTQFTRQVFPQLAGAMMAMIFGTMAGIWRIPARKRYLDAWTPEQAEKEANANRELKRAMEEAYQEITQPDAYEEAASEGPDRGKDTV